MNRVTLALLLALGLSTGCGSNSKGGPENPTSPQTKTLNQVEYVVLEDSNLVLNNSSVEGVGTIAFVEPRPNEDSNYFLQFSLADGGRLKLIANAQAKLKSGVELVFAREGNALKVVMDGADLSEGFTGEDATKSLSLKIDVHAHGHAIFWLSDGSELAEPFRTRPKGVLWGLELKGAKVTGAVAGSALEEH